MSSDSQNQLVGQTIGGCHAQQWEREEKRQQPLPCKLEKQIVQLEKLLSKINRATSGQKDNLERQC